jgi:hypothetical protein
MVRGYPKRAAAPAADVQRCRAKIDFGRYAETTQFGASMHLADAQAHGDAAQAK